MKGAPHAPVPTAQHDPRMQATVGNLLRIGVLLAAAVVLVLGIEMIYHGLTGRI